MIISTWDQSLSGYENLSNNLVGEMMALAKVNYQIDKAISTFGTSGGFIGDYSLLDYLHNKYGFERPTCLLEKIIREIKRIAHQVDVAIGDMTGLTTDTVGAILRPWDSSLKQQLNAVKEVVKKAWDPIVTIIKGLK